MTIGGKLGLEMLDPNNYVEIFERFHLLLHIDCDHNKNYLNYRFL